MSDTTNQLSSKFKHSENIRSYIQAATTIQSHYRRWRAECIFNTQLAILCISSVRQSAATRIQNAYRGHRLRSVYLEEENFITIRWRGGGPDVQVKLYSSVTDPPWQKELRMRYCFVRSCWVFPLLPRPPGGRLTSAVSASVTTRMESITVQFKFVVNGEWESSEEYATVTDNLRNVNNILYVVYENPPPRKYTGDLETQSTSLCSSCCSEISSDSSLGFVPPPRKSNNCGKRKTDRPPHEALRPARRVSTPKGADANKSSGDHPVLSESFGSHKKRDHMRPSHTRSRFRSFCDENADPRKAVGRCHTWPMEVHSGKGTLPRPRQYTDEPLLRRRPVWAKGHQTSKENAPGTRSSRKLVSEWVQRANSEM
eukprot:GHVO01021705.1.p1 GENE.GHVO01021705.1~~GHVO01021705.1.p1  ORF type:complete len:370 (+),score=30.77 GHVO01021705.1:77-1186(+)